MTASFLVTGGTGTLGRPVAQRLRDAGASVTVISRRGDRAIATLSGGMIADWQGVRERLRGAAAAAARAAATAGGGPDQPILRVRR